MSITQVEILPSSSRVPTWGELRGALPEPLRSGRLILAPYVGAQRAVRDDELVATDEGSLVLEIDGEPVTGLTDLETDELDVDAFRERIGPERSAAWLAARRSYQVWVQPTGEWREFASTLARLVEGLVLVQPTGIGIEPGLYTPDQLAA